MNKWELFWGGKCNLSGVNIPILIQRGVLQDKEISEMEISKWSSSTRITGLEGYLVFIKVRSSGRVCLRLLHPGTSTAFHCCRSSKKHVAPWKREQSSFPVAPESTLIIAFSSLQTYTLLLHQRWWHQYDVTTSGVCTLNKSWLTPTN